MDNSFDKFLKLAAIFRKNGYVLFLVGGASREFLLGEKISEFDCATDATADEMEKFLFNANFVFRKYGTVTMKIDNQRFEITTLRTEGGYINYRYPSNIQFVKKIEEDYVRRDFTINAIYLDEKQNIYDFTNGQEDLHNKVLRMIGDPIVRLTEDPLRIIRAFRFAAKLDLTIEESLSRAIFETKKLLDKLNKDKIFFEFGKVSTTDEGKFLALLKQYQIEI